MNNVIVVMYIYIVKSFIKFKRENIQELGSYTYSHDYR